MVYTEDLKSSGFNGLVGSSPTPGTEGEWRNGSRASFRNWFRKEWRFESSLAHKFKRGEK